METTVTIPAGVFTTPVKEENSSRWREANLVRWNNGVMAPFAPWEKVAYSEPASNIRGAHRWSDNLGRTWEAFLCEGHLYVEVDGDLEDISPTVPIEAPSADFTLGGFGDGDYGEDDYGDARASRPDRKSAGYAFTIQNWGEDLLVMVSTDGRLLRWSPPAPGDPMPVAAPVPNAPSGHSFVVTPERHVMIFQQGGNFAEFAWCDEEDIEDWDFASTTNKAGFYPVEPASPIITSISAGDNGVLFWTTKQAYNVRWIGLPGVYTQGVSVGEGSIPVSPQSVKVITGGRVLWMTEDGLCQFDGVSVSQLICDIWPWIKDNCDFVAARYSAFAVNMTTKSEFWWFFPSTGSGGNDRMVVYNYKEGWWSMARISRTAGFGSDFSSDPVTANGKKVYRHNRGQRYADTTEKPWVESFNVTVKEGQVLSSVRQIQPAIEGEYSTLRFSLATQTQRLPRREVYTPLRRVQSNGLVDFMVRALDFRLRIEESSNVISDWRVGPIIVDYSVQVK